MSALPAHSLRRGKAELLPAPLSLQRRGRKESGKALLVMGPVYRAVMQLLGRADQILAIADSAGRGKGGRRRAAGLCDLSGDAPLDLGDDAAREVARGDFGGRPGFVDG